MLATDDTAKVMLERYKVPMPNQNLSPDEIRQLVRYFKWAGEHPAMAASKSHEHE
jgi:nitrite reductase (NO-forming)